MIVYNWVFCIVLVPPNSDQKQSFPPSLVIVTNSALESLEYCLQHLVCHFLWLQFSVPKTSIFASRCVPKKRPPPWRPSMTWTARWNGWKRCPAEAPVWSQCCTSIASARWAKWWISKKGESTNMGISWDILGIYIYIICMYTLIWHTHTECDISTNRQENYVCLKMGDVAIFIGKLMINQRIFGVPYVQTKLFFLLLYHAGFNQT